MVELSELSFFCLDSEELWMERNFFFFFREAEGSDFEIRWRLR